jgi:hypothetical protein
MRGIRIHKKGKVLQGIVLCFFYETNEFIPADDAASAAKTTAVPRTLHRPVLKGLGRRKSARMVPLGNNSVH